MMRSTSGWPPSASASAQVAALSIHISGVCSTKCVLHAEIERRLHRLDRLVAAIGIAGEIRLAHAADDMAHAPPIGQRGREGEEQKIAAGHESSRQPVGAHLITASVSAVPPIAFSTIEVRMVVAERSLQAGNAVRKRAECGPHASSTVALAVVEAHRLHAPKRSAPRQGRWWNPGRRKIAQGRSSG